MAYYPDDPDALPTPPPWEEEPPRPPARRKRRGTRGRRPARKRRGIPWWAWALVVLGWLGAFAVVGVAAWFLLGPGQERFPLLAPAGPSAPSTPTASTVPPGPPTATPATGVDLTPTTVTPSSAGETPGTPPSPSATPTETPTWTPSATPTATATATLSPTSTPTWTPLPTTPAPASTATWTPTVAVAPTAEPVDEEERTPGPPPETEMVLLVPFYVYPYWWDPNQYLWDDLARARQQVTIVAIINPDNGPGGPPNEDYQRGMAELQDAGVVMVGYVPTEYGQRSSEAVRLDVNLYADYFPVQGIFFDQVPTDPEYLSRYSFLYEYARTFFPAGPVIFNFGTLPPQEYLNIGALSVVFEDEAAKWWTFDPSQAILDFELTGVLVHSASVQDMKAILQEVRARQWAKYVYFTDDVPPNPWDALPSYWDELLNALAP